MRMLIFFFTLTMISTVQAQESDMLELPYKQIPEYPENYSSGNIVARLIDGLGYRYYWATEGLTDNDLKFVPSNEARSTFETMEHIYLLSETIVNATRSLPNVRPVDLPKMTYNELRGKTLLNFKQASELVSGKIDKEIADCAVIFQRGGDTNEFPFWNMINGPISDAIYHTGQVTSFRRSSGNPINPKVNVFIGKTGN